MGHHHHHHHASGNIRTAFLLNLGFALIEIVGGLLTNSVAILSDALHDFGDAIALGGAWYAEHVSKREADARFSYGYGRISLLAALVNALVLLTGSVFIISQVVTRLMSPEATHVPGIIGLALLGIAINSLAAWRLRGEEGLNARMVSLHLLEDVLGWAAVLVVGIILLFAPWYVLDPILSLAITLYILYNVVKNLKATLSLFLQALPEGVTLPAITAKVKSVQGVIDTHHTHLWSLDGDHHVLSSHVVVDPQLSRPEVSQLKHSICDNMHDVHLSHITLEIEFAGDDA
ncbi:MAG: cation diffusion facilitator family transporter, partial [Deinococcota bacterium]